MTADWKAIAKTLAEALESYVDVSGLTEPDYDTRQVILQEAEEALDLYKSAQSNDRTHVDGQYIPPSWQE